MTWVRVADDRDLWDGETRSCSVGDRRVLLVRAEGVVRAYEDRCAHLGVPLSLGSLEGSTLTCSAHHWQYDVRTGRGVNPASACLTSFPVEVRAGGIHVDVEADAGGDGGGSPA